jgi:endonuclease YncB( thermonuclease family)
MVSEAQFRVLAGLLLLVTLSCASSVPSATPFPFTVEIATPEATLDLSHCSTIICCSDCPDIPVHRIIDGDTFVSANATIRLFGVDTPKRVSRAMRKLEND